MSAEPRTGTEGTSELLADRAYAALRDRIVQLRIAPGGGMTRVVPESGAGGTTEMPLSGLPED